MTGTLLTEANAAKPKQASKGIWRTKLISADVQGSTGFYPAAVLERDGSNAFPAGTHVYFDHPSEREEWDRPERSVRDLAGALIESAQYVQNDPEGPGLYAPVQFFPDARDQVESMADVVGMSIRAAGTVEETDMGPIVTAIIQGISVDIVTHAGAGGRLVEMTEAARPQQTPTTIPVIQTSGLSESDRSAIQTTNNAVAALTTQFSEFLTSLKEAKDAKDKAAADAATLTVGQITAKLTESGLPAASQKRLAEAYISGQDFDAAVTDEKAYVQSITEAAKGGKPAANGQQPGSVETTDSTQQIAESVKTDAGLFDELFA